MGRKIIFGLSCVCILVVASLTIPTNFRFPLPLILICVGWFAGCSSISISGMALPPRWLVFASGFSNYLFGGYLVFTWIIGITEETSVSKAGSILLLPIVFAPFIVGTLIFRHFRVLKGILP
jgi:hypothetical protein